MEIGRQSRPGTAVPNGAGTVNSMAIDGWAQTWGTTHDDSGLRLRWSDAEGDHESDVHPPNSDRVACGERVVTPNRQELVCGRIAGHGGSHVQLEGFRGAVAD